MIRLFLFKKCSSESVSPRLVLLSFSLSLNVVHLIAQIFILSVANSYRNEAAHQ